MSQDNSYNRIFKGVAVFGGTQVIQILIRIVRAKLVSILIGAKGMGLQSIYTSSTSMVVSFAGLGLNASGVRDISAASTLTETDKRNERMSIINQCFYLTYIIGFFASLLMSPLLSYFTFGDFSYTLIFIVLSFYVVFEICSAHHIAVLQGFGLIKKLAKATIFITICSLILAVSVYYIYGIKGIVPVLVADSAINATVRFYQVRKIGIPFKWHPIKYIIKECRTMFSIGAVSLISIISSSIVTYLINVFISRYGTIADVGFFQAANVIVLQSVSMVFTSMNADYYPRLAKIANDREETNLAVNRQSEILCYIAMPILGVMIVAAPLIIHLMLSKEFLVITDFIKWICLGTAFQVFSYPLGHMSWAKGDMKVIFLLEAIYNSSARLVIYVASYYLGGLEGLGYGICLTNLLYLIIISIVVVRRYDFVRDNNSKKRFIYLLPLILIILLSIHNSYYMYGLSILVFIAMTIDCLYRLEGKLHLIETIKKRYIQSH